MRTNEVVIVYDGECPLCRNYCKLVRLKKHTDDLVLIDARQPSAIMDEITALGWDIDQGMVVRVDGQMHYGSKAINIISLLSTNSDLFNRITSVVFSSQLSSKILYPALRDCRNFALWILDIPKINNIKESETK